MIKTAMKTCVLASGSSGNCIYVGGGSGGVLIDAGLSGRETVRRLEKIGVSIGTISAICLTHEHADHIAGLAVLHERYGIKIFANSGTIDAVRQNGRMERISWQIFSTNNPFEVGDLVLHPFPVSHDAYEPVGFVISCGAAKLGIATDIGAPTHLVREHLRQCQALIVEANHDEALLSEARRPWVIKQRIAGRQGHLSNRHAAEMIASIASPGLARVFLCHLSRDCNRPELAEKEVRSALAAAGFPSVRVSLTFPSQVSETWFAG